MNKVIQKRYLLREKSTGKYVDDCGYVGVDLQDADWTTTQENAEEWLSYLDYPEEFEIVKVKVQYEIVK